MDGICPKISMLPNRTQAEACATSEMHLRSPEVCVFNSFGCQVEWKALHQEPPGSRGSDINSFVESKNALPVFLHADDGPAFRPSLIIQRLGEGTDFAVRQTGGGTVGVLALRIIVQN